MPAEFKLWLSTRYHLCKLQFYILFQTIQNVNALQVISVDIESMSMIDSECKQPYTECFGFSMESCLCCYFQLQNQSQSCLNLVVVHVLVVIQTKSYGSQEQFSRCYSEILTNLLLVQVLISCINLKMWGAKLLRSLSWTLLVYDTG